MCRAQAVHQAQAVRQAQMLHRAQAMRQVQAAHQVRMVQESGCPSGQKRRHSSARHRQQREKPRTGARRRSGWWRLWNRRSRQTRKNWNISARISGRSRQKSRGSLTCRLSALRNMAKSCAWQKRTSMNGNIWRLSLCAQANVRKRCAKIHVWRRIMTANPIAVQRKRSLLRLLSLRWC